MGGTFQNQRKTNLTEQDVYQLIEEFERQCDVIQLTTFTLKEASLLRTKYNLSFWDSLILATAVWAEVESFYSEDMQH